MCDSTAATYPCYMHVETIFTSAGVPTKDPTTPAAIPRAAFMAKPGGLPSGL